MDVFSKYISIIAAFEEVAIEAAAAAAAATAAGAIKFALFLLSLRPSAVPYFLGILTYRGW